MCEFRKDSEVRKHEKLAAESRRKLYLARGNANQPGRAYYSVGKSRVALSRERLSSRRRAN